MADAGIPVEALPSPAALPSADSVDQAGALFVRIVTHPAAPAFLAAVIGHFIIDAVKDFRDKADKPALRPAWVRIWSIVITQLSFMGLWAAVVHFRQIPWGELDFLYGLAGSFGAILWHHVSPWRDRGGDIPPPAT